MKDNFKREINYMRISVTDGCNLRCRFCMPKGNINFLNKDEILSFEEIKKVIKAVIPLGINNFRVTGGEPLTREGIVEFISDIKRIEGVNSVTLSTNGVLLAEKAEALSKAKLDGVNVSLTSLDPDEFGFITNSNKFLEVLEGIAKCIEYKIHTKINCTPVVNINEDNIENIAYIAKKNNVDVRFIEMMPIGMGAAFESIKNEEVKKKLESKYGISIPNLNVKGYGPATYYKFPEFLGSIGFISANSHSFCSQCNRVRLTADGYLKLCLNYKDGISIKELIRKDISSEALTEIIKDEILKKPYEHNFNKKSNGDDNNERFMSQIGG